MLRRHPWLTLAAVSLVLCVAVCVLWVRSCWRSDAYAWSGDDAVSGLISNCGTLCYVRMASIDPARYPFPKEGLPAGYHSGPPRRDVGANFVPGWRFAGFSHSAGTGFGIRARDFGVPDWSLALSGALVPAAWVAQQLRRGRRGRRCLCPSCGYDLRASPERCPECGAEPVC